MNLFNTQTPLGSTISYREARGLAVDIVRRHEEGYRDEYAAHGEGGRYFRHGESQCLVGAILEEKGYTQHDLLDVPVQRGNLVLRRDLNGAGLSHLIDAGAVIPEDAKTKHFLSVLQSNNDHGVTWKTAVQDALRAVGDDPNILDRKPIDFYGERNKVASAEAVDWIMGLVPEPVTVSTKLSTCVVAGATAGEHVLAA